MITFCGLTLNHLLNSFILEIFCGFLGIVYIDIHAICKQGQFYFFLSNLYAIISLNIFAAPLSFSSQSGFLMTQMLNLIMVS